MLLASLKKYSPFQQLAKNANRSAVEYLLDIGFKTSRPITGSCHDHCCNAYLCYYIAFCDCHFDNYHTTSITTVKSSAILITTVATMIISRPTITSKTLLS